ncbi:Mov34/MPN/PAD-1 family protein [Aeromonas hydrophila]
MNEIKIISEENFTLEISENVHNIWNSFRQIDHKDLEACGVLIGAINHKEKIIFIDLCSTPQPKDRRSRYSFSIRDCYHQQLVDQKFKETCGKNYYLGTWHTHPEEDPTPSYLDVQDWKKCMKRNMGFQHFAFAIVGLSITKIFIHSRVKD